MPFIIFLLPTATIFGHIDKALDRVRHLVTEQDALSVDMAGGPSRGLDQTGLIAQESLLVGIQDADQGYLWNTGIFIWKASVLLDELSRHAQEISDLLPLINNEGADAFFERVPVSVIDRAVMERSDRVGVVEATFNWDDVGSWEALSRTQVLDQLDNVSLGNVELVGARGSIAYQEGPGRIVLMGTEDLVVVQVEDTTMVMPRARASQLKELLDRMEGAR